MKAKIKITYCPKCRWLLRAAWMQQELLTTFEEEIGEIALAPAEVSGEFNVYVDGKELFSRSINGRFPDIKELKKLIRDQIAPQKSLGHTDL